jgi:5-methylcytosine-specific restriction endonuclease McrA
MQRRRRRARGKGLRRASPRRRLEIELDHHARLACLMAAGGSCEKCGAWGVPLEAHHIITRRFRALRWTPQNLVALCRPCHLNYHAHPKLGRAWFVARFGEARLAYLRSVKATFAR